MVRVWTLLLCGLAAGLSNGGLFAAPATPLDSQEKLQPTPSSEDVETADVPAAGIVYEESPLGAGPHCADGVSCGDEVCCAPGPCGRVFYAAFEPTFVQPRFSDNTAFTVMQSDGASFESFSDTEFDYDFDFAPRVIAGLESAEGVGVRATWWQYDHEASPATSEAPSNGFGAILPPAFGDVVISTTVPGSSILAATGLNAYAVDLEITKLASFAAWELGVACGVRYANVDQFYRAETTDAGDDLIGRIYFQHKTEGVGPTLSLSGATPLTGRIDLFGRGRGALLFGDDRSNLSAVEDLDLTGAYATTRSSTHDGLLPIGELQLGVRWLGSSRRGAAWRPFATLAMEGQFWGDVGDAASEEGDLGFFGVAASGGVAW